MQSLIILEIKASPAPVESTTSPLFTNLKLYSIPSLTKVAPFSPRVIVMNFGFNLLYKSISFFKPNLFNKYLDTLSLKLIISNLLFILFIISSTDKSSNSKYCPKSMIFLLSVLSINN